MRVSRVVVGAVVVVALAAGGCSSGGDDAGAAGSTATSAGSSTTVDPAAIEVAQQYLEALTTDGGPDLDAMTAVSAPDSVAEHYAVHTAAVAEVQAASGEAAGGGEVRVDGDTVIATLVGSGGSSIDTTWADFTLDGDGRLVDFTIDGTRLDDRLIVDGASETVSDVTITVASAFELVSNDSPVVVLEIENAAPGAYRLRGAAYEAPDGTTLTSSPAGRGLLVRAGTTNRAVLVFDTAPFAGTLELTGIIVGGATITHELPLTP